VNQRSLKLKGLGTVLSGSLIFVVVVVALNRIAKGLFARTIASGIRQQVTVELTAAMIAEVGVLVLAVLLLGRRGLALRSLGLWRPAPAAGWLAAGAVAVLFLAFNLALPLRAEKHLTEISLFHLYNAVTAAFVAGFVEETLFRGFVMTELQRSGWGNGTQIMVSSILYGAVHASWGLVAGMFTFKLIGGAVIGTAVFGCFCSAVYLVSRRSLMPVILCHGMIDFAIEPWLFMVAVSMAHR
jgi:membrane protease YdiL (CAAX protease family)